MKKVLTISFILFVFLAFACKNTAKPKSVESSDAVSFDSFNPRSVSVKNNTGEDLVAFKGTIELSSLISGVPAHASNHGLKMDANLFPETGDFALLFVKKQDFLNNKGNLSALKNKPFASIYAFYNKDGTNNLVYTISGKSGGNATLTLQNNSAFNVEIRSNSPNGEVLGYVGAHTANTVLKIDSGDYVLYPVFKKYLKRDNEIYSIVPKFKANKKPYARDFAIPKDGSASWNVGEIWDEQALNLSSGGFYITINNQAETAVRFKNGDQEFETSLGVKGIPSGSQATFFVRFERKPDGSYPDGVSISTLKIGTALYPKNLPTRQYKLDEKYEITVTGREAADLTLGTLTESGKVNIEKIFGL